MRTGSALRVRKSGTVTTYDAQTPEKKLIELAYEQAEAAGIVQLNEDEAGPYQAIPQPGASWQPEGHPALQPHEYERGGTAKLLTLFRPATGEIRATGVVSVTNAVLHPWRVWGTLGDPGRVGERAPRCDLAARRAAAARGAVENLAVAA